MDDKTVQKWADFIDFLKDVLGDNHEIVLHVIGKDDIYIGAIANNHISGRTVDSPLTSFAFNLINEKVYKEKPYVTGYKAVVNKSGKVIQGATYFITNDDGELEGMLCINTDLSAYHSVLKDIMKLGNMDLSLLMDSKEDILEVAGQNNEPVEILSNTIQDIIAEVIDPNLIDESISLSQDTKIEIVAKLYNKGIFQLKGSVIKVADILNVSVPSIYRYLRKVK